MPTWDEAADWYVGMLRDPDSGFNDLAVEVTLGLLGDVAGRSVLDVGCGEGHVARRLALAGATVTGVEPTAALLGVALAEEERRPLGISYARARAEDLAGVASGAMDAAVAVLVLHHVADVRTAMAELHRVMRDGGVLVAVLPHPWVDHPGAGWSGEAQPSRLVGDYVREGFWSSGAADGPAEVTSVRDVGWYHRTVATWITELAAAGFRLEVVREPVGAGSGRPDRGGPWADVPRFLALRAIRNPQCPAGG